MNFQELEDQVERLEEEKIKLKIEVTDHKSAIETLKEELVKNEEKFARLNNEKGLTDNKVQTEREAREKVCDNCNGKNRSYRGFACSH